MIIKKNKPSMVEFGELAPGDVRRNGARGRARANEN